MKIARLIVKIVAFLSSHPELREEMIDLLKLILKKCEECSTKTNKS